MNIPLGQTGLLSITVTPGLTGVNRVLVHGRVDPTYLHLVDVRPSGILTSEITPVFSDTTTGEFSYGAELLSGVMTEPFVVMVLEVRGVATTSGTLVEILNDSTDVSGPGGSVLSLAQDGLVMVTRTSLTIIKKTDSPVGKTFYFISNIAGFKRFWLKGNGNGMDDRITFDNLTAGFYTITETVPSDWKLLGISCDGVTIAPVVKPPAVTLDLALGQQVECTFTNERATAVELISFAAQANADKVTLTWETAAELDNEGFNIWRSEAADGSYVKLNSSLIPAQGNADTGASYEYIDTGVVKGSTYYYKLEDLDISGVSTFHGPISAAASPFQPIYLPLIISATASPTQPIYLPVILKD
jgi:hypothetical protein